MNVGGGSGLLRKVSKTITFDGAAGTGAVGAVPIYTVTGEVLVSAISATCTADLTGAAATIALGITGSTALFIGATTATTIDNGMFWVSTTPTANGIALPAACKDIAITDNIIGTVAVANVASGSVRVDVYYAPLSSDGLVA